MTLSPENRALIDRDGGLGVGPSDSDLEDGFAIECLNRLLDAARAEGREQAALQHEAWGRNAAPGTGGAARHEHYAKTIRGL